MFTPIRPSISVYRYLTMAAALLMLLPLPVMQYVGEEGLMAIKSYEMFFRNDWLHPSIFGGIWPHSPLWHWPVIGICKLIGWQHVDIAIRLVSVIATWLSAIVAALTAAWLFEDHKQKAGWLAALVYLSMGEVAFWYGWLGYVDATFGFFIFAAIISLWRAIEKEHFGFFLLSLLLISLAFLTKNITAYALYGASGLVLLWQLKRWALLKRIHFPLAGLLALMIPVLWQMFVIPGGQNTVVTTTGDILRNFIGYGLLDYLKHWITYPFIFLFRALPISLLLVWLWLGRKQHFEADQRIRLLGMILLVCFLPFWLSAHGTPRYLVPLYGLVALIMTGLLFQLNREHLQQGVWLMALIVALKIPYSLIVLPGIKDQLPGRDIKTVAEEIAKITADTPIYSRTNIASGLAIVAYLNVWQQGRPPIRWYGKEKGVYILSKKENPELGQLLRTWLLRGDMTYLYWKPKDHAS